MKQLWTVDVFRSRESDPTWYAEDVGSYPAAFGRYDVDAVEEILHQILPDQRVCDEYLTLAEQVHTGGETWFDVYFEPIGDGPDQIGYVASFHVARPAWN